MGSNIQAVRDRHDVALPEEEWRDMSPQMREAFQGTLNLSSGDFYDVYKTESYEDVGEILFRCVWYAAYGGRVAIVEKLCSHGDVTNTYRGDTPLHAAARKAQLAVIKYLLLKKAADINVFNEKKQTPLHLLLMEQDSISQETRRRVAEFLLSQGAFPDVCDREGITPRMLLPQKGWDIPLRLSAEKTLFQSLETGDEKEFQRGLSGLGKRGKLYDAVGYTPFHRLVFSPIPLAKKEWMIRALTAAFPGMIDAGDHKKTFYGIYPVEGLAALHKAAEEADRRFAALLLEAGANPNGSNKKGETPLHSASTSALVELLCEKGAKPNQRTQFGETPLHRAARKGRGPVLAALLRCAADPTLRNEWKETPLHRVATAECAEILLRHTPELINLQTKGESTALHLAIQELSLDSESGTSLIEVLLKARADLSLKNKEGVCCTTL